MKVETEKLITLTLTEDEARWLKSIVQNPLWVDDPNEEDPRDKDMRSRFWVALEDVRDDVEFTILTYCGSNNGTS